MYKSNNKIDPIPKQSGGTLDYEALPEFWDAFSFMTDRDAQQLLPVDTYANWKTAMVKRANKLLKEELHEISYDVCKTFWDTFTQMPEEDAKKLPCRVYEY